MACAQCDCLIAELKFRHREHMHAFQCMAEVTEPAEPVVFARLRAKLSDARVEHELARLTLEKHQQDGHAG
jgi:hypothetical protein